MDVEQPMNQERAEAGETVQRVENWLEMYLEVHPGAEQAELHEMADSYERSPLYLGDLALLLSLVKKSVGEPGTRYLVVEVPPEATEAGLELVEDEVVELVHHLNEHRSDIDFDIFCYRQHSAPPFEHRPEEAN